MEESMMTMNFLNKYLSYSNKDSRSLLGFPLAFDEST